MKIVKKSLSGAEFHHGGGSSALAWRSKSITTTLREEDTAATSQAINEQPQLW